MSEHDRQNRTRNGSAIAHAATARMVDPAALTPAIKRKKARTSTYLNVRNTDSLDAAFAPNPAMLATNCPDAGTPTAKTETTASATAPTANPANTRNRRDT